MGSKFELPIFQQARLGDPPPEVLEHRRLLTLNCDIHSLRRYSQFLLNLEVFFGLAIVASSLLTRHL